MFIYIRKIMEQVIRSTDLSPLIVFERAARILDSGEVLFTFCYVSHFFLDHLRRR